MTRDQAFALCPQLEAIPGLAIVSIGRFVPWEDVRPDSPWRIAVYRDGWERPAMINTPADVDQHRPKQPAPARAAKKPAKVIPPSLTPMLFD